MKLFWFCLFVVVPHWSLAADSSDSLDVNAELNAARTMIDSTHYKQAVRTLNFLVEQESRNADAWNLLGYSYRKLGNLKSAEESYKKALLYNPEHKGALEYQGELLVELNDLAGARLNLEKLQQLCPDGCEELTDLEEALARQ